MLVMHHIMNAQMIDDDEVMPLLELEGSPREMGLKHGKVLGSRIKKTIAFYHSIFKKDETDIFKQARHFQKIIREFNNDYADEIEAIAEGAEVDPLWIYALNARTEILTMFVNECTAFYFTNSSVLAQNWDWAEELEKLAVLVRIKRPDGHVILQLTEPGIIGKIGMNSAGIGVTLNFLHIDQKLDGIPVHIVLRSILDSDSMNNALETLKDHMKGKSSNVIIGSSSGSYLNLEFAGKTYYKWSEPKASFVHTNHFLKDSMLNTDPVKLASSFSRYERATTVIEGMEGTVEDSKNILTDKYNSNLPICRPYVENEDIGNVGTICTIIMELKERKMHLARGNPSNTPFDIIDL